MKVLQINTTGSSGSTGRIASEIGDLTLKLGHESTIGVGRIYGQSKSSMIRIGNRIDFILHVLNSRMFDRHGFGSKRATDSFISRISEWDPDIVHLHNIHGYYIHIGVLFDYLGKANKPVIWTFHDCWPFTGHCSHFQYVNCVKWQSECVKCPNIHGYPKSWFIDNSRDNYSKKKGLFTDIKEMILVSPSAWLAGSLSNSFLSGYETMVINNGVDLKKFRPFRDERVIKKYKLGHKYILGVASVWTDKKGLADFIKLRKLLDPEVEIVLVGVTPKQAKSLPYGIKGILRTETTDELATIYSKAEVFVNPTYVDNFPSVNIENLACGTPVITYNTGGSPESIDEKTGIVVKKGDINALAIAISVIIGKGKEFFSRDCRLRAETYYNTEERSADYFSLYQRLINNCY